MDHRNFGQWMARHAYSTRTARVYVQYLRRADLWLTTNGLPPIASLTDDQLIYLHHYAATLPMTYSSRKHLRYALAAYWRFLRRPDEFPVALIPVPKRPRMVCKALEPPELEKVLEAAVTFGPRVWTVCCLLYYAALRREEAATVRWDDLHRDTDLLHVVGKGGYEDWVEVHPAVWSAIDSLPEEARWSAWLFPSVRDPATHISPATVNAWVQQVAAASGVRRLTPHIFRHTALATANDRTGDFRAVMAFARHRSPEVTKGYTRTTRQAARRVIGSL